MKLSFGLSAVVLCAVSVLGDLHNACWCNNGGEYNYRITAKACTTYSNYKYKWGTGYYDVPTGHCIQNAGSKIAGDQWQAACQEVAKAGFPCSDGAGTCYANVVNVRGAC